MYLLVNLLNDALFSIAPMSKHYFCHISIPSDEQKIDFINFCFKVVIYSIDCRKIVYHFTMHLNQSTMPSVLNCSWPELDPIHEWHPITFISNGMTPIATRIWFAWNTHSTREMPDWYLILTLWYKFHGFFNWLIYRNLSSYVSLGMILWAWRTYHDTHCHKDLVCMEHTFN